MRKNGRTRNSGYTLIELLIVMVIFIVVIIISSSAFNTALTQTKKVSKSEESNIEGVIGLEMFRHDLEQAGFGLVVVDGQCQLRGTKELGRVDLGKT